LIDALWAFHKDAFPTQPQSTDADKQARNSTSARCADGIPCHGRK